MKAFNLLITKEKNEYQKNKELRWLLSTIVIIGLFSHVIAYCWLSDNLKQYNSTIAKMSVNKNYFSLTKSNVLQTTPSAFHAEKWLQNRNAVFNSLFKLTTPPDLDICFTSIQISQHAVILTGNSSSAISLTDTLLHHRIMRQFNQIHVDNIEADRINDITRFQLTCR